MTRRTRRPAARATLAALVLACAAALTACGPTSSGPASSGPSGGSGPDDAQVQQMQQKVDAADSAAAQAEANAGQDD
ncbi:hypothetical protein [Kitasatospora phosalacinea]|uniref:Uncharacterized protein n=1 Tax=Kitasatospora phosalacinea TaxID=2065 RepID=A0A9W6UMA0_9ACTN|nr:hypothetical protein [Kitasatospora phosalacinea]GLW53459.1 hypothetical protein Kpho01_14700 [Kitasatospora phosalacinea]